MINEYNSSITELHNTLESYRKKVAAIQEDYKRIKEESEKEEFYKLQLTEDDLDEVQKLRHIGKELRDPAPLNKMIWSYYFRNSYNDLCGRVLPDSAKAGIYKITNCLNGMIYIGQTVNLRTRWSDHIKMGLGADPPSRNKL